MSDQEASLLLRIKEAGGEVLEHFVVTLGEVKEALMKVAEFLASFVEAYGAQEKAVNALSAAMVQNGMYSDDLKEKYAEMAEQMSKNSTYSAQAITDAQATLQSMIGQKEITEKLMQATMDLAAHGKMSLASASEMVGKAISNETNVLARQGIQYDLTSDKGERMHRVVDAIETKFGGLAASQAQGLGVMEQVHNAWEGFQETVGAKFAPVVEAVALILRDLFTSMQQGSPTIDLMASAFKAVSEQAILFARDIEVVGKTAGNIFAGLFGAFSAAVQGNWKEAWNQAKSIVTVSLDDITAANEKASAKIASIDNAESDRRKAKLQKEEDDLAASNKRREEMKNEIDIKAALKQLEKDKSAQDQEVRQSEMYGASLDAQLKLKIKNLDQEMSVTESYYTKKALMQKRAILVHDLAEQNAIKANIAVHQAEASALTFISTTLQSSMTSLGLEHNTGMFLINKAAAIANALVATEVAATQALAIPPPPVGIALSAVMEGVGLANVAVIAGTAIQGLATGGIVKATNGGTPFIIGEGGKDEAVIPLDEAGNLGGGGTTINFHGPVLGDSAQAEEFAKVIDKALFRLRQTNQSMAFDTQLA